MEHKYFNGQIGKYVAADGCQVLIYVSKYLHKEHPNGNWNGQQGELGNANRDNVECETDLCSHLLRKKQINFQRRGSSFLVSGGDLQIHSLT